MRRLLARFPRRRAVGLHVGDREVALSRMAITPLGPVEVDRRVEPREPASGPPTAAIRRLVEPLRSSRAWRRAPVAVGIPGMGVFFSTRPARRAAEDRSPQVLLHEILQSAHLNIDHMEVDAIRWQPGRLPLASVAACRRKALAPILGALEDSEVRPHRVEPAPCGLLRLAVERHRTPRRCPSALRVFLGREHALAVLTAADAPLMWRYFPMEPGSEATAILSTYRYIADSFRVYGAEATPSAVLIHGRPELLGLVEAPGWSEVPARVVRLDGPAYEAGAIAAGLALGCLPHAHGFNFAGELRPPDPVLRLLPWGQMAVQALVLAGASMLLVDQRRALEHSRAALGGELAGFPRIDGRDADDLRRERDDLSKRASAIEHYLSTRILWTDCAREVAERLPEGMVVTTFEGHGAFASPNAAAKAAEKRSLTLSIDAPIQPGGAVSPEVEGLLDALRAGPTLRRSLPTITMAGLRWGASGSSKTPSASFSVLCLPGAGPAKKPSE